MNILNGEIMSKEEKPKFIVVDSASKRFITNRCIHDYERAPFQRYKDLIIFKCKLCGKIKKRNSFK